VVRLIRASTATALNVMGCPVAVSSCPRTT